MPVHDEAISLAFALDRGKRSMGLMRAHAASETRYTEEVVLPRLARALHELATKTTMAARFRVGLPVLFGLDTAPAVARQSSRLIE